VRQNKVKVLGELPAGSRYVSEMQFLHLSLLKFEKHALTSIVEVFVGADLCTLP